MDITVRHSRAIHSTFAPLLRRDGHDRQATNATARAEGSEIAPAVFQDRVRTGTAILNILVLVLLLGKG
jgi:hypothetical protein